ncbi:MAG TPA: ISL3 family transposase [Streptosporangiaceae bacterium]|nr:ISL3 family transposase [Streptosporangiaceae bacterium]
MFALDGAEVAEVDEEPGGGRTVWVMTADPAARVCPLCETASEHVREQVVTRPADIGHGRGQVRVAWVKRRWECRVASCPRGTFTESLPAVPPRCRVTERLRDHAGRLIAEDGRTVAQAARECGLSWPVAHAAFAATADPLLDQPPAPVAHLGIDEHRRGRPRWRADAETGEYVLLADRWHTCFFDLSGDQGLLGQVEGRTADDAAYWLAQAPAAWRDAIRIVAIDMCAIYASAVRRALPRAQLIVDLFHVVQLAVKMTADVRRRAVREKYGRRGRSGDAEYGIKSLLVRNLEHLRLDQFAKVVDTLGADRHGQEIAAAWIGKEKLRDVLNLRARVTRSTPCERDVRGRLASFYDWCAQNDDIAELLTLARTISKWEDEIVAAVLTGVTNARSEALNRLAKLEARIAYSFRNPANQRRRVRIACTRTARRSPIVPPRRSRQVTGRQPDPG